MTKQEQRLFFDVFTSQMAEVMLSKGDDYAGADRLSNFKNVGTICQLQPEQACLSLIATKVARLGQLLTGKEPNNESIADSVLDLANYSILLAMLLDDKK
jgi:hypothetical protein